MDSQLTPAQQEHFDDSKKPAIVATLVLLLVLSNILVAIRFGAQLRTYRRLFAEDYLIIFALVSTPGRPARTRGWILTRR